MNCPHCETEIDEHEANRCLDAWVGEVVMGWEGSDTDSGRALKYPHSEGLQYEIPKYSTSIAAAWELVGHFSEQQYEVSVSEGDGFNWSRADCNIWAPLDDPDYTDPVGEGWDETRDWKPGRANVCLTICRAALKATIREIA